MATTPVKIVLFLAGGTVAAGGTAYFAGLFDNFLASPPAVEASAPNAPKMAALPPSGDAAASGTSQQPSGEVVKPGAGASTSEPSSANTQDAPGEPKVEVPSFDIVRVEPGGSIVIAGHAAANAKVEAIIGSRTIGGANAGPEGDFAIVLDKPLAPGDYSIVLRSTTPDNVGAMSAETAVVSIPDTPAGQVLALVEGPGKPSQLITVPEPKNKPADAASTPAEGSGSAKSDTSGADSGNGESDAQQAAGADGATVEPAQKGDRVQQEVASAPEQPSGEQDAGAQASSAAAQPVENQSGAETKQAAGQEIASAGEQAKSNSATQPATADGPKVAVEAVEIEGRKIFVAGSATPGTNLRAYANEILLGDATASNAGRFLIEAERDLPVGDYIVRVDALGPDGVKVLARAAVPFEREAGEKIAAVAPTGPANETKPASAGANESGSLPMEHQTAAGEAVNSEGGSGAGDSSQTASDQQLPAHSASAQSGSATAQPAEVAVATQNEAAEALAPKLQSVDGSVIIRRGDSLWRISKRVYGRGVRYSTIYLANQDQIRDPHKIWPGQVFKVPEKTGEGEKADMTRLGDQALQPRVTAQ